MTPTTSEQTPFLPQPATSFPNRDPSPYHPSVLPEKVRTKSRKKAGESGSGSGWKLVTGLGLLAWLGWEVVGGGSLDGWTGAGFPSRSKNISKSKHSQKKVDWTPCWENKNILCGYLEVPTDYNDSSIGITTLALSKIPAKVPISLRKGSILVNYGGPGVPGRSASFVYGDRISDLAPSYDIISWDGRGIGRTVPAVNCYGSAAKSILALAGTTHESTFDVPPFEEIFTKEGTAHLVAQQREALSLMEMQGSLCNDTMGAEVLKYFGTTTLILDTERISAVLEGPDALINGWSGSYGTIWTSYLVNMLPEKVGRIVTYGVADPPLWATGHYESYELLRELLHDAEKGYEWFLTDCLNAGHEICPLTKESDKSFKDIKQRIAKFLDAVYLEPMPVWDANRPGLLKSGMVRKILFETLQSTEAWPWFANALSSAMDHSNGTLLRNRLARPAIFDEQENTLPDGFVYIGQEDLQRLGVSCADAPRYEEGERWPDAEGMVDALKEILGQVSETFGGTVGLMEQHGGCQFWPQSDKLVRRFTGPWNSNLSNTILIASNSHDPITPAKEGRKMAKLFGEKARHVIADAPGHCYLTKPTGSFASMLSAYYENGTIPTEFENFYKDESRRNYFLGGEEGKAGLDTESLGRMGLFGMM